MSAEAARERMQEGAEAPPPGVGVMAVVRWLLILALFGAAVFTAGRYYGWWTQEVAATASYRCPMHPAVISDRPGTCSICGMDLVPIAGDASAATGAGDEPPPAWACPLHPDYGGEAPGACPVCGEALVRNPSRPPAGLATVTLDAARTQQIGVRTARVRRGTLAREATYAGQLTLDERGLARVQTRFSGWLESVRVTETGALVKKGQVLATVFSNDVQLAQGEYVGAMRALARAPSKALAEVQRSIADAARKRLLLLGVPSADLAALEQRGAAERLVTVRAPVTGRVLSRAAFAGAFVQPGMDLFTLGDLSRVWFVADVPEADALAITRGQRADLTFAAFPTRIFTARASFVYPLADAAARTIKVRFELRNPKGLLRPGLLGHVTVGTRRPREVLIAPAEAVVDSGEERYAFVARGGGRFEPRRVAVGARAGEDLEIVDGLREGEEVVTSAGFLIDSESRLRAAAQGMAAPMPTLDGGAP